MTRWQWVLIGVFAFITYSVLVALVVGTPQPTPILMPTLPTTATPTVSATSTVTPTPSVRTHIVLPGETLVSIAQEYDVAVEAILELNGLTNPNVIEVGQELLIPLP